MLIRYAIGKEDKEYTIPDSVTSIGDEAFGYCKDDNWNTIKTPNFHIYCYKDTAGEKYAIDNGFDYKLIGSDNICGDLNSDGKINLLDLIALRKHLAKWSVEIDIDAADCNVDGKVNLLDLILMRKYLAKWNVILGPQK